jgi:hypothetical protein
VSGSHTLGAAVVLVHYYESCRCTRTHVRALYSPSAAVHKEWMARSSTSRPNISIRMVYATTQYACRAIAIPSAVDVAMTDRNTHLTPSD